MTARSIRRAAERKAAKRARKAEQNQTYGTHLAEPIQPSEESESIPEYGRARVFSSARIAANRANSQLSTGPCTAEGKAKSSLNAVKTALTGRTVLLPSDYATKYEKHIHAYLREFQPKGQVEIDLTQSIADTVWRLQRIPGLEMALYAQGHLEFADCFQDHDASLRPGMIELQIYMTCEKKLRNLHLQEARLHRRREKDLAELRKLQEQRRAKEAEEDAAFEKQRAAVAGSPENGFVFSNHDHESQPEHICATQIHHNAFAHPGHTALDTNTGAQSA